jgi:hypothetical protein
VIIHAIGRQRNAFRYGFEFLESDSAHEIIRRTCRDLAVEQSLIASVQYTYSFANFASGYAPSIGANPSGTSTSTLNIGTYESLPLWASLGGAPSCSLGNSKISLGGGVATKYNGDVKNLYNWKSSESPNRKRTDAG